VKPAVVYILNQPEPFRSVILHVIAVIETNLPGISLEYKWSVPYFYYKKKPFCYLNASHKHHYVDVGFAKGFYLKNNLQYLIADNGRNTVKSLRYKSLEEVDNAILTAVLLEASKLY